VIRTTHQSPSEDQMPKFRNEIFCNGKDSNTMKAMKNIESTIGGAMAAALVTVTMTICLIGCATFDPLTSSASSPGPRVEDCALIQQATPARFVCAGKVYTAIQLADIRKGKKVQVK
jgi:hypothetical protein